MKTRPAPSPASRNPVRCVPGCDPLEDRRLLSGVPDPGLSAWTLASPVEAKSDLRAAGLFAGRVERVSLEAPPTPVFADPSGWGTVTTFHREFVEESAVLVPMHVVKGFAPFDRLAPIPFEAGHRAGFDGSRAFFEGDRTFVIPVVIIQVNAFPEIGPPDVPSDPGPPPRNGPPEPRTAAASSSTPEPVQRPPRAPSRAPAPAISAVLDTMPSTEPTGPDVAIDTGRFFDAAAPLIVEVGVVGGPVDAGIPRPGQIPALPDPDPAPESGLMSERVAIGPARSLALEPAEVEITPREEAPRDVPSPVEADLIAGLAPLAPGSAFDEAITRLMDHFDDLILPGDSPTDEIPVLIPVVVTLVALEAARRWRGRQSATRPAPGRSPRSSTVFRFS